MSPRRDQSKAVARKRPAKAVQSIPSLCTLILAFETKSLAEYKRMVKARSENKFAQEREWERRNKPRERSADATTTKVVAMPSQTAADLLAKVTLYQSDPERFQGAGLDASIMRDVVAIVGKGGAK